MPKLTAGGTALALVLVSFIIVGLSTGYTVILFTGAISFSVMACSYLVLLPLYFEMKRRHLVFSWNLKQDGSIRRGAPFGVEARLHNKGALTYRAVRLEVLASPGVEIGTTWIDLPRFSEVTIALEARARRVGFRSLHGAALQFLDPLGLFSVQAYCPRDRAFRVVPEPASLMRGLPKMPEPASGVRAARRKAGPGFELREIRDHQPGDPFRNIAWKATARMQRLMVKEFDRELRSATTIILDRGVSMRAGKAGASKLDFAIQTALALAERVVRDGESVGLATFSQTLGESLPPRSGKAQLAQITNMLLRTASDPDPEDVEGEEDGYVRAIIAYLASTTGDSRPLQGDDLQRAILTINIARQWSGTAKAAKTPFGLPPPAESIDLDHLRHFVRGHGLDPPLLLEEEAGPKDIGLKAALEQVLVDSAGPQMVVLLTDLCGYLDPQQLIRPFVRLVSRRQRPVVVALATSRFDRPPRKGAAAEIGRAMALLAERSRQHPLKQALKRIRIPVIPAAPQTDISILLKNVERLRARWRRAG